MELSAFYRRIALLPVRGCGKDILFIMSGRKPGCSKRAAEDYTVYKERAEMPCCLRKETLSEADAGAVSDKKRMGKVSGRCRLRY